MLIFNATVVVYEYEIAYLSSCNNPVSVDDPSFVNVDGWPLRMIEAPCAWSITKGNSNVLIGVADTEFRTTHVDMSNKYASVNGISSSGHPHGAMISSIAAASTNNKTGIAGIGYNSRISAHRIVHDNSGNASSIDIKVAIQNLHNMGVKIINASWSITGLTRQEVQTITQAGTTFVLPGGNTPSSLSHSDIADIPGVIVVSGVNSSNMNGPTGFARNKYIDLCAPGDDIIAADGNSDTGYAITWGTSFAAPFVSGTIALMLSVNPNLTPEFIEQIIKATADPVSDGNSYPGLLGTGRLNAYKAVQASITSISGSSNICYGSSYSFSTTNAPAGFTWNKSSNLNISGSGNSITVSASSNSSGSGWVSVNCGGLELKRYNVTVSPILVFSSITGPSYNSPSRDSTFLTFYANFTGASPTSYNWSITGIPSGQYKIRTMNNFIEIGVTQPWNFKLSVTGYGGCNGSASGSINVNMSKSMFTQQTNDEVVYLSTYPNPSSDVLNIDIHNINQDIRSKPYYDIRLYDSFGVLKIQTFSQNNKTQINVSNLLNGLYFLHVYDEMNKKLMKQKIVVNH